MAASLPPLHHQHHLAKSDSPNNFDYSSTSSSPLARNVSRRKNSPTKTIKNPNISTTTAKLTVKSHTCDHITEVGNNSDCLESPASSITSPSIDIQVSIGSLLSSPVTPPPSSPTPGNKQLPARTRISSCNGTRRTIFSESCYQQQRSTRNNNCTKFKFSDSKNKDRISSSTPSYSRSPVTNSIVRTMPELSAYYLPDDMKVFGVSRQEIKEFLRPSNCRYQPEHLTGIEEHPNLHRQLGLPELPSPLQRMRKNSGVYPLLSPQSILRKKSRDLAMAETSPATNHLNTQMLAETLTQVMAGADRTKLTPSPSSLNTMMMMMKAETLTDSTESLDSSGGSQHASVRFDPRVTVTEYDDNVQRQWYSESELREFQSNTVLLVKQYLINNPAALIEYNTPRLDPVTGVMRRKALFSIPILGIDSGSDEFGISRIGHTTSSNRDETRRIAEFTVKTILIVDRNQLILDLFRRSLQILFPKAQIITSDSGDEAFAFVQSKLSDYSTDGALPESFDIIIAEERLYIPLHRSPAVTLSRKVPNMTIDTTMDSEPGSRTKHVRVQSFNAIPMKSKEAAQPTKSWAGISGSELFQKIRDMERVAFFASATTANFDILYHGVPPPHCSLLIGVSTNPNQDSKQFLDQGADFVWGKPPPCMNIELRNKLITALINKRTKVNQLARKST